MAARYRAPVPARSRPRTGGGPRSGAAGRGLLVTCAGLAVAHGGPGVTAIGPVRRRWFPALSGYGASGHLALTFDDGPDPRATPRLLDLLGERGVRATFFLLGTMAAAAPALAAEVAAAGHQIALHGHEHRMATWRGPRAAHDDLSRARDVIAAATGTAPRLFRPPYGVLSGGALLAARRLGLTPLLWTCWGREWTRHATVDSVRRTVLAGCTDGDTLLLHDSEATSTRGEFGLVLRALPALFDDWERRGLRVGPVGDHGLSQLAASSGYAPPGHPRTV